MQTKKLKPESDAEQALAKSPEGIRELIRRHQVHSPLVRTVARTTDGLSELDAMTLLAFYAISGMEDAQQAHLDHMRHCASPISASVP
jgi:hypothetical protein